MSELRANIEDVRFDFPAADRLAARFRLTGQQLESQIAWRRSLAGVARQEWRGRFAEQFDGRMAQCGRDADVLVIAMKRAAILVDDMARVAREEQQRRVAAHQWFEEQKASNPLTWVVDKFDDWWSGPDVPPQLQPSAPLIQTVELDRQVPSNRE